MVVELKSKMLSKKLTVSLHISLSAFQLWLFFQLKMDIKFWSDFLVESVPLARYFYEYYIDFKDNDRQDLFPIKFWNNERILNDEHITNCQVERWQLSVCTLMCQAWFFSCVKRHRKEHTNTMYNVERLLANVDVNIKKKLSMWL